MKCIILAGGRGTRIAEESQTRPKPMVEIGGMPILWHIMKIYSAHGVNDFIICLGYMGYVIKEFFCHYALHSSDVEISLADNQISYLNNRAEPWRLTLVDTGLDTQTGGRLARVRHLLNDDEPVAMTYGDGVANIDLTAQFAYHRQHGKMATMTTVRPPARFGAAHINDTGLITAFDEKPPSSSGCINGGYFVLSPQAIDYVSGDGMQWEADPLNRLVAEGQLMAWQHDGFWQAMDTLREKLLLEELWRKGNAPWKVWP